MMRKFLEDKYDLGLDAEDTIEVVKDKEATKEDATGEEVPAN